MSVRALQKAAALGVLAAAGLHQWRDSSSPVHKFSTMVLQSMDPEQAHRLAVVAASSGFCPKDTSNPDPVLATTVWGLKFPNPIGLAAGMDKHCEAAEAMLGLGFGFVEIGSVTPLMQAGNTQPRVFRLTEDKAIINRYGFNSFGHEDVKKRLAALDAKKDPLPGLVGVNLGKNKESIDAADDYCKGVVALGPHADYIVVNVSSPNTAGLRDLQEEQSLYNLLSRVKLEVDKIKNRNGWRPPLLVKIAPDIDDVQVASIASVVLSLKIDGIVVTNTTIARPEPLISPHKAEVGGLSGRPLTSMSTAVVRKMFLATSGKIPIIGVGGVSSGEDAYNKIRAGASVVQLYSALSFEGPGLVRQVKEELAGLLRRDGFKCVAEAVGADCK